MLAPVESPSRRSLHDMPHPGLRGTRSNRMGWHERWLLISVAVWVLIGAGSGHAGGFYNRGQSVTALGSAFAGSAVLIDDVSTIFFNPAGLTTLNGAQFAAQANLFLQDLRLSNSGSILADGTAVTGSNGGNPFDPIGVPAFYAAYPVIDRRLWVGFGLSAPFGLGEQYRDGWFGRYSSIEADLRVLNATPTVAWAVTNWLSLGFGLDIQRSAATLSNAVLLAPGAEAFAEVKADVWDLGWNAGILIRPWPGARLGASFRSGINRDLKGSVRTTVAGATQAVEPVQLRIDTPDIMTVSFGQQLTDRLTLLAGVEWSGWSTFEDVRVRRVGGPDAVTEHHYRNTFALSVGGQYEVTDAWTLRAGFLFDRTPTVDAFRETAVPEGNRYALAGGVTYRVSPSLTIDAAIAHFFMDTATIDVRRPTLDPTVPFANIKAKADWNITVLSAGIRYKF